MQTYIKILLCYGQDRFYRLYWVFNLLVSTFITLCCLIPVFSFFNYCCWNVLEALILPFLTVQCSHTVLRAGDQVKPLFLYNAPACQLKVQRSTSPYMILYQAKSFILPYPFVNMALLKPLCVEFACDYCIFQSILMKFFWRNISNPGYNRCSLCFAFSEAHETAYYFLLQCLFLYNHGGTQSKAPDDCQITTQLLSYLRN